MSIETQFQELIEAVKGIDCSESAYDYNEHLQAIEWQLNELRQSLESIAGSLKIIANK